MRRISSAAIAAVSLLLFVSGCQHVPPKPLDLKQTHATLQARDVGIEPVKAYATALATLAGEAGAVQFDTADGLSLREAKAVALWYNPQLRIARLQAEQARAVARMSGGWADPELGLESGRKSVESDGPGFLHDAGNLTRSWINAATLAITIPLSGRLGAEARLHRSEYDVASLGVDEAEWLTLAQVCDAWARWSATTERVKLLDGHLALLSQFADSATALAAAGEVPPSSARLFAIERMRKEAERAREVSAESESRVALLQLLGLLPDAPVQLVPEMNDESPVFGEHPNPEAHPTMARLRAEYQAAEDRLRLELRKQYPDLVLSPAFTDEDDESSLTIGLGFPVPVWNRNRQGIAEATSAREVARAKAEAEYQRLISETVQAQAALKGSQEQRARLLEGVVPAIDAQMNEALSLLKIGEVDMVVLYEALTQALETKQELLNATLAQALAASRLSAATARGELVLESPVETDK